MSTSLKDKSVLTMSNYLGKEHLICLHFCHAYTVIEDLRQCGCDDNDINNALAIYTVKHNSELGFHHCVNHIANNQ